MPGVAAVQSVLRETLEDDYAKGFAPLFAWSSRVRKNGVPFFAVDELRNATDHFARAMLLATAAENGAPLPSIGDEALSGDPLMDAARGRRHMVAGEYQCLFFIARCRLDDIKTMLTSILFEDLTNPETEVDELNKCIAALADVRQPNTTAGASAPEQIDEETNRTVTYIDKLTDVTIRITEQWRRLSAHKKARLR